MRLILKNCCIQYAGRNYSLLFQNSKKIENSTHYKFCSSNDDITSNTFKDRLLHKHFVPQPEKVQTLKNLFQNPTKVIYDVFEPFEKVDKSLCPALQMKKMMNGNIYRADLQFTWPIRTSSCGIHKDKEIAVENAYLAGCQLLQDIGLIKLTDAGVENYKVEHVVQILENLANMMKFRNEFPNFYVVNDLAQSADDMLQWTSKLQVHWPVSFTASSTSACLHLAYYQACLRTVMKFKALGYLDKTNNLKSGILIGLDRYNHERHDFVVREFCEPDFEIFVDSSTVGMGAYLMSKDNNKIRWIADTWDFTKIGFEPSVYSNLAEFYALVTACYTWKHKFVGKKVLCYSDNRYSVNLVNHGLNCFKRSLFKNCNKSFDQLYLILSKICHKYNVNIIAQYVPRSNNVAADYLSRIDIQNFKSIVPSAHEKPKKSKKLWFCCTRNTDDSDKPKDSKRPKF